MPTADKAALEAKRKTINARLRALRGQEKGTARKQDDQRKILAGAFLLEQAKRDPAIQEWMTRGFAWFLTRPNERALFNLGPTLVTDKADAAETHRPVELPASMGEVSGSGQTAQLTHGSAAVAPSSRTPKAKRGDAFPSMEVIEQRTAEFARKVHPGRDSDAVPSGAGRDVASGLRCVAVSRAAQGRHFGRVLPSRP